MVIKTNTSLYKRLLRYTKYLVLPVIYSVNTNIYSFVFGHHQPNIRYTNANTVTYLENNRIRIFTVINEYC